MTSNVSHQVDTLSFTRRGPLSDVLLPVLAPAASQPGSALLECVSKSSSPHLRLPGSCPLCSGRSWPPRSLALPAGPRNSQDSSPQAQLSCRHDSVFQKQPQAHSYPCWPLAAPLCSSSLPRSEPTGLSVALAPILLNPTSGPLHLPCPLLPSCLAHLTAAPSTAQLSSQSPHITLSGQHSLRDFALVCTPVALIFHRIRVSRALV